MTVIYYAEINIICIIVLCLLMMQVYEDRLKVSTDMQMFRHMLNISVVLCVADMLAGIFRGATFDGARQLIEVSNIVYFIASTSIGYLWSVFVNVRLNRVNSKTAFFWAIPLLVFIAVAISNPWTGILFSLDGANLYQRGPGIHLHWIVSWLYILTPTFQIIHAISQEKSQVRKQQLKVMLYFVIFPAFASLVQILFYGVSCFQAGIVISLNLVYLMEQNGQILTDALTGLNNRRSFDSYLDDFVRHTGDKELLLMMLDIDNFKYINDRYGHVIGDQALRETAEALKKVCSELSCNLFLCRYGGDEFVIAGSGIDADQDMQIRDEITRTLQEENKISKAPFTLTVSIGSAIGICDTVEHTEQLLSSADEAMYKAKMLAKQRR